MRCLAEESSGATPPSGDVGDCALLCSSPAEFSASDRPRLPLLIRQELAALTPPIPVFNPRGEDAATIGCS